MTQGHTNSLGVDLVLGLPAQKTELKWKAEGSEQSNTYVHTYTYTLGVSTYEHALIIQPNAPHHQGYLIRFYQISKQDI